MTVTIQLTTAGIDTGTFSIFSNLDLVTPLVTGVSRTSLLTGYPVVVPDAATSVIVKSNTTNCTNQVTIPISGITTTTTTSTTTTTTGACQYVIYGFDATTPEIACENYYYTPYEFYFNGVSLYVYDYEFPALGCGPFAQLAEAGYYSDGENIWFWDGVNDFSFDSSCNPNRLVTISAKRTGAISGSPGVNIVYSTDLGATWNPVCTGAILGTSFSPGFNTFSFEAPLGGTLWIGALLSSTLTGISFGAALSPTDNTCLNLMAFCGNPSVATVRAANCMSFAGPFSYNSGLIFQDKTIYLNFNTISDLGTYEYIGCS